MLSESIDESFTSLGENNNVRIAMIKNMLYLIETIDTHENSQLYDTCF